MNFIVDLDQPEEILWKSLSKSGRQSIRTASNKGLTVEEITDRRQLMIAYNLLRKVYSRVHVPVADISLFEVAYELLAPSGMLKIFLARVGDEYVGACFILLHKGRMIDWYAGTDRVYSSYSAGELLIWRIIQWGKEHDFHVFDFGGGGKPSEDYGPRKFKSKFGGKTVLFGRNICIHSPFSLQLSRQVYLKMQKVLSLRSPNSGQRHNV